MNFEELISELIEGLSLPLSYFSNSEKRIHYLYLATSLVLAGYVYLKAKRKESFWHYIFNPKVWWGKSAFIDYFFLFFNGLVKVFLIAPYVILGLYLSYYVNEWLISLFGYHRGNLSVTETLVYYTITITIVGDFATWLLHLLLHKIPLLWEFHKVHHSATSLNPLTQYRIHPVELILNNARSILVFGLITGIFDYLSDHQISKVTFLGVNALSFLFLAWGANLRHSHVKLKYFPFIEKIFISPYQHQIHHSNQEKHYDKNLGSKLAIWDHLFGTLVLSKDAPKVQFGLGVEDPDYNTSGKNLIRPFWNPVRKFWETLRNNH